MADGSLTPPWWDEGENERVEVRKRVGSDKDCLTGKAKAVHTSKEK